MRKIVLIMLMVVMLATPCLAQEIEPQGLFTLNNTLWVPVCGWDEYKCIPAGYIGFSGNNIFYETIKSSQSLVINFGLFSFYWATFPIFSDISMQISGFANPMLGIGFMRTDESSDIDRIKKVEDNWTAQPFLRIVPYEGEQESNLKMKIVVFYTTFKDSDLVDLSFDPPEGIAASNIRITGFFQIEFDLNIAVDTPVGFKSVTLIYDDGSQVIIENDVFEVIANTN